MTDTQNSYKDEYTILSGNNKEAIFTQDKQKILCEGTEATIISTGNEVELVDNYINQDHKGKHIVGVPDTLHGDGSFFISTGDDVLISAGKNSHTFALGDRSNIEFSDCQQYQVPNMNLDYNFGRICAVISGNESIISAPDNLEQAIFLSTGNNNQVYGFKGTNTILAGENSEFGTESGADKSVINYSKNSTITALGGVFIDLGENTKISSIGETIIFTKPGAEIYIDNSTLTYNNYIITAYLDPTADIDVEKGEVSRIVKLYRQNVDYFERKTYKVGEKGELIDITPSEQ